VSILSDITDLSSLAQHLFPNGKLVRGGTELRAGDVNGSPGSSLSIKLESGIWIDHNGGEGGDLVDVLCHRFHLDYRGAAEWLRVNGWLNRPSRQYAPAPVPRPTPAEPEPLPCAPSGQPLPYKLAERFARSQRWQLLDDGLHLHPYAWPDGQIPVVVARYQLAQGGKQVRRLGWGARVSSGVSVVQRVCIRYRRTTSFGLTSTRRRSCCWLRASERLMLLSGCSQTTLG